MSFFSVDVVVSPLVCVWGPLVCACGYLKVWLHSPLTWSLVLDEEKLEPLLEGVFIDVKLHLHPVRGRQEQTAAVRGESTAMRTHKVPGRCFFYHSSASKRASSDSSFENSLWCFANHLPEEGFVIICLNIWFPLKKPVITVHGHRSTGASETQFTKSCHVNIHNDICLFWCSVEIVFRAIQAKCTFSI